MSPPGADTRPAIESGSSSERDPNRRWPTPRYWVVVTLVVVLTFGSSSCRALRGRRPAEQRRGRLGRSETRRFLAVTA